MVIETSGVIAPRRPEQLKLKLELPLEDTIEVHIAARVARVSCSTIRRWCGEGRIRANQTGKIWRIYRAPFYDLIRKADNEVEA